MTMDVNQPPPIEPGKIVAGKYRIERFIGRGGMGRIVAARHLQLDEVVALKFLLTPEDRTDEFRTRFLREAQITAKLRGAHVARTLDFGVTDEGEPFIVMEYLEGINLRQLLRENGPLPVEVVVNYAIQACEGLAEAHRLDVVHRDLKPANLFLTKHLDGADLVKILDFGVSKLRNFAAVQSDLTEAGAMLGSPKYMSIEQLAQAGDVDERADVWSLGTIIYEMLRGKPPFVGKHTAAICMEIMHGGDPPSLRESRPEIPPALEETILRCLRRNRDDRTPNVAVLARELAEASGIDGLELAAKAVDDVLHQPRSLGATGQVRAFGQTGSNPSASGRSRPFTDGSRFDVATSITDSSAGESRDGRSRLALVAVVGLLVAGGIGGYFALRSNEGSVVAGEVVAATASSPVIEQPDAGVDAQRAADKSEDASSDVAADVQPEAEPPKPKVVHALPTWRPPPPPPATTAATAAPTKTKKPPDAFGSRY